MSKIAKSQFQQSLDRLEGLTKSQLFHTPSDSNPGNWAGSAGQDEDSMDDEIQENGTDYDGVKKALANKVSASKALTPAEVKIIKGYSPRAELAQKIAKGQALTGAERWALGPKGSVLKSEGMANSPTKDGAAEEGKTARNVPGNTVANKEDGKELPESDAGSSTSKSFQGAIAQQPQLQKAIEMSPVLHEMTVALGYALDGSSEKTVKSVMAAVSPLVNHLGTLSKSFNDFAKAQSEYNASIGEAVLGIGQHIAGGADVAMVAATQPARGAITTQRAPQGGQPSGQVIPIAKSFNGPGGLEDGQMAMQKSQVSAVMADMVKSGRLSPLDVIKFESTGEISPQTQQAVMNFAAQSGQR